VLGEGAEDSGEWRHCAPAVPADVCKAEVFNLRTRFIWQILSIVFRQGMAHCFCPHLVGSALKFVSFSAEIHCRYIFMLD
jgi:hypothetical protein